MAPIGARGLAFDVFIGLEKAMSEDELLLRAGKPDSEVVENVHRDIVKTCCYFPPLSDPWITTILRQGGRISGLDHITKF